MTKQLRPYQRKDVELLLSQPYGRPHFLLANDVGTGKTPTVIEAAKQAGCKNGIILCTASIKRQWERQAVAWGLCEPDEIQVLYGLDAKLDNRPWKILNYALVREKKIREQIKAGRWHALFEDECQNLKTHESQQTKAVFHKSYGIANSCYWKWPMSGTLMPNRPLELYPILRTHFPEVLGPYINRDEYIRHFCGGAAMAGRGATNVKELTERLQPVMIRRTLAEVWQEMPETVTNTVYLDVNYREHPEWVGDNFLPESTERRIIAEAKIPHTVAYIADRFESGVNKLAVFTYHRSVAEGLEQGLAKYNPVKIYGGISANKREISLQKFIQDPDCRLIILQIMSAGEGIDGIQHVCNYYVRAEPEWCPGREDQAGGRIMRLGQQRTVFEDKLIAADSYEDVIGNSNLRKRKVIDVVLKPNGGNFVMSIEETLASIDNKLGLLLGAFQSVAAQAAAPVAPPNAQPPALPAQSAPLAAPAAPAVTPSPSPSATVIPVVPPVTAAPTPPVPAAAPTPPAPAASGMTRDAFEKSIASICNPYGANAVPVLKELRLQLCPTAPSTGEIPPEHFETFIAALSQRLPAVA